MHRVVLPHHTRDEPCVRQAVRTKIKDKDLPMDVSVCYLQHMRAVRPAATQLDVKRSTHKKLSKFVAHLAAALAAAVPASSTRETGNAPTERERWKRVASVPWKFGFRRFITCVFRVCNNSVNGVRHRRDMI